MSRSVTTTLAQTRPAPRQRPRRFLFTRLLVLFVGVVVVAALIAYLLLSSAPAHWRQNQRFRKQTTAQQRAALAEDIQMRVLNGMFGLTDGGQQRVSIHVPIKEANAWLEMKLPGWLANQNVSLPGELADPMIALDGRSVVIAFEVRTDQINQIVSMTFDPKVVAEGKATLTLTGIKAGRLTLPLQTLVEQLRSRGASAKSAQELQNFVAICEGQVIDAKWKAANGRICKLAGLEVGENSVDVTFTSHPRELTPGAGSD